MTKDACILLFASVMLVLLVIPFCGEASQFDTPDSGGQLVRVGVLARRGPEECLQSWGPTAEYLGHNIEGFHFQIVPLTFEEVVPRVQAEDVDFVVVNSSIYVELQALFGAARIATMKDPAVDYDSTVFGGVIFTRADRLDIESIDDLKGKSFMGVDETSLGGWRAAWREFKAKGIDPYKDFSKLLFSGTHDAVVYAVRDGKVDAGTIATPILEQMTTEGKIEPGLLRVINSQEHAAFPYVHSTRLYPNWPFAKLKHTPNALAVKIVIALLSMPRDSPVAIAAGVGGWTVPLDYGSVDACLRELRIGIYKDFGKVTVVDVLHNYKWQILGALLAITGLTGLLLVTLRFNHDLRTSKLALRNQICERQHAEAAFKRISEQNELILLSAGEGIFGIDLEGKVTFVNPAAGEMVGYEKEELIGKDLHSMIHHSFPDGTHYPVSECPMWQCLRSGTSTRVRDEVLWKKDCTSFPSAYSSTPIIEDGIIIGAVVTFRDITVRKRAEEALQKSEGKYRLIVETANEGIWAVDAEHRITFANAVMCEMLGYSIEEIIGQNVSAFIAEDHLEDHRSRMVSRARGSCEKYERKFKRRDGGDLWMIVSARALMDENGGFQGAFSMLTDITERKLAEEEKKRLEAQLLRAQKLEAIGTLASGIAHDFNNILVPIIGYTELALKDLPQSSPMGHWLEQILNAACRARDLVKQILAFGRSGKEQKQIPVEISSIVKEALRLLRASLPSSIEIRQDIHNVVALADATQIHQVLMNLCTNAAHAMDDKGILEVSLSRVDLSESDLADQAIIDLRPQPHLKLCISDSGIGMEPATLARIFDPYFTTKEVGKGTGLGLAVVHGIVKRHGGAITVQSEPGKGTIFCIYIPAIGVSASVVVETGQELPSGTERILLIDDEEILVEMGTAILGRLGYKVTAEMDSLHALEIFRSRPGQFDLIITDYTMPKLNGADLSKEIRRIQPDMPIILCTGFSEKVTEEVAIDLGVELVMKPFGMKQIAELVRKVLRVQGS